MVLKTLALLLFFINGILSSGEELADRPAGALEGTIVNEENRPISHAHIALPDIDKGTVTRPDGTFLLENIPEGEHRVVISHVGFKSLEKSTTIRADSRTEINIELTMSKEMPQVEVVGSSPDRLARIPGSATVVTAERLEQTDPMSATEVLRQIPGIHSVDHEGVGLRANIGIRGLDPDRSRNVLILEDGMPVALAPYGEPEMYYTPSVSRMESVEVIKGSGSIKFGPQTVGGVINFITPSPPPESKLGAYVSGGERGYFTSRIGYGNTYGQSGFHISHLHRRGDEIGPLNFQLHDINAKWKLVMGENSILGAKVSIYDETSNSTYVGLSQPMYESGQYNFTDLATDDVLDIRRYSASITHDYFFNDHVHLQTSAYGYTTKRNWLRQDFDNQPVEGRNYPRVVGDPDQSYGAIWFREGTGNRNREFEVIGIEPRLSARYHLGDFRNELNTGFRYLYERAYEQRINGTIDSPATGDIRDDEIRTGYATSGFVQNRFYVTPQLTATPGLRLEHFIYERNVLRHNFEDSPNMSTDYVFAMIPGLGLNYQFGAYSSAYTGVHRGFSPPRVKDALTADGTSEELDSEWSWSYEAGFRVRPARWLKSEITAYYMTFENQIIPVSESAGGHGLTGATGLTNGGATVHYGLEFQLGISPNAATESSLGIEWELGGTLGQAHFSEDRYVSDGDNLVNIRNNELPYAPKLSGFSQLSLDHVNGLSGYLKATFTGEQYGDVLNRTVPGEDGREGMLESFSVFDAGLRYRLPTNLNTSFSVSVKNLTDERYISSRRPQGIRLGIPRMITFGVNLKI